MDDLNALNIVMRIIFGRGFNLDFLLLDAYNAGIMCKIIFLSFHIFMLGIQVESYANMSNTIVNEMTAFKHKIDHPMIII